MVKLRLRRRGRKRLPIYDIVAADSRSPRDGRIIERIGQYSPTVSSGATMLDRERAAYWIMTGAQPTDTVRNILSREGLLLEVHMQRKGASADEISTAVETHLLKAKSREAQKDGGKKEAPAAPAAEVVEEAPAAEVEATEEAPAAEVETTEEAPAAEVEATEEAPAAEVEATEEATAAEVETTEEAPAAEAEATGTPAADEASADEEKAGE